MPKIKYISKTFRKDTLDIIAQANQIIQEYQTQGFDLTLRQLYYQFVSRDLLPNKQKYYDKLGTIISNARLAGMIDWRAIEDRTRNIQSRSYWDNPGQIIGAALRSYRRDRWEGQEYRPEVWIEKEALIGVISSKCRELDVSYFACKGYVSQSEMWNAAQRFQRYQIRGQQTVIIHLGDHDPSGIDMTRDIQDRQTLFKSLGCTIERIALNMDQIDKYNPPPNPAKLTDSRCGNYIKEYGSSSWELDALEPSVMTDLIEQKIVEYRDDEVMQQVINLEDDHKRILENIKDNWETL